MQQALQLQRGGVPPSSDSMTGRFFVMISFLSISVPQGNHELVRARSPLGGPPIAFDLVHDDAEFLRRVLQRK